MPPGRPGRGKAAQGEEPQEGGARGNAPPNFEHSTTADHGKQGTKSRKKHGLLPMPGPGKPLSPQAGDGPDASPCGRLRTLLRPCASVQRLQGGGGAKGAGTKRSAARGAPAWPGADALAQMGQVQMAPAPAGKGKEARRSPAPWLPQAPEDSSRSTFETAQVRSSPLAPAQVSWSPQAGTPTPLSLPSAQDSAQDSAQNSAQGSAQDVALGRWLRSVPRRPRPWHKLMPAGSSGQEAPGEGRGAACWRRARLCAGAKGAGPPAGAGRLFLGTRFAWGC